MCEPFMDLSFDLTAGDFERAGEASGKIKKTLQQIGVSADIVRRVAIGTYEGEMNVIIHSHGGTAKAHIYPEYTVVVLEDTGPGIADIELAVQEGYSTAPDYVRDLGFGAGMGLPNMKSCSDCFEIVSKAGEGTKITMRFAHKKA
ncbi:MAG: ATP-binding protein [Acidaminococcales bacterium]|jgi:anti-sigma regulatory factor (Ser/Thr protein kinase)|nr:ATP-binding protein [Acidaminococcales bacterium]